MKKLLLTAFEPFGGETINPSLETLYQVAKIDFPNTLVRIVALPVERYRATEMVIDTIKVRQPDIIVMLGESGGRSRVTPERVAINVDDYRIPDNAGDQPQGEPIVEGGPVGYFSTLPVQAIVGGLSAAGIPSAVSNSAGTYLCNRVFYTAMHFIAMEGLPINAGFIHLPYMHEQVLEKRFDLPSMARETLVEAVRLAIEVTLRYLSQAGAGR